MRWLFLLLLVLNVFYYVWHQQEAPMRAKDVTPLSLYRGAQHDIRLLSESAGSVQEKQSSPRVGQECLFLGGFSRQEALSALEQRLVSMVIGCVLRQKASVSWGIRSCRTFPRNSMS
jgi:hypothetical protein